MKKRFITWMTLILSVLTVAMTGCNDNGTFTAKSFSSEDSVIKSVVITVHDREISVTVSSDNQIHLDYFESEKEFYDVKVSKDNVLTMNFAENKEWKDYIGTKSPFEYRKISIKIPYALLSNLTISTTNEKIELSSLLIKENVVLSSNGGNIEFEKMDVGNSLVVSAKNGDINGTIVGSYDFFSIACTIKKGECNLPLEKTDGEKSLKVNCNNGNTNINFVQP